MNDSFMNVSVVAMGVLAVWGLTNLVLGVRNSRRHSGNKAFWQMTAGWGLINLILAGLTLIKLLSEQFVTLESANSQIDVIKVNIVLDVVYVLVGYALRKRNSTNNRAVGFGRAIIIQGLFLLVFDIVLVVLLNAAR